MRSNLKFTAKQLNRLSVKCEKEEKQEKEKIRKCMEKGNHEGARIHAQNAIRNKLNAQNYLRLSSRVDAVSSRLESALKMQQVTKSMGMPEITADFASRRGPLTAAGTLPPRHRGQGHGPGALVDERRQDREGDGPV